MECERVRADDEELTPWAVKDPMNSSKSGARSIDLPPQIFHCATRSAAGRDSQ